MLLFEQPIYLVINPFNWVQVYKFTADDVQNDPKESDSVDPIIIGP